MSDSPIPSTVASKLEAAAIVSPVVNGEQHVRMTAHGKRVATLLGSAVLVLRTDAESAIALAEKRERAEAIEECLCAVESTFLSGQSLRADDREFDNGVMACFDAIRSIASNTGG